MYHRDFVVRLIQQLLDVLLVAVGLKDARQLPRALEWLDDAFRRFFGWDSDLAVALPLPTLLGMLGHQGRLDADRAIGMASLLRAQSEVLALQGRDEGAYHRAHRALELLLAAHDADPVAPSWEPLGQVEPVLALLAAYELPLPTLRNLARFHEARGALARAEDRLFELIARDDPRDAIARTREFYQRLLALPDAQLRAADLPRSEIHGGLAELDRLEREYSDG